MHQVQAQTCRASRGRQVPTGRRSRRAVRLSAGLVVELDGASETRGVLVHAFKRDAVAAVRNLGRTRCHGHYGHGHRSQ